MKKAAPGVRELARSLDRSPSHICRVLRGERKASAELMRKLRAKGIRVSKARGNRAR
jgi:plasmid maintenance system antidote protein VapI